MNFYEELGISPSASVQEIRQAYKSLARLFHPDLQNDQHLRKLAELQMTRLNEILRVLTDPVERERYNRLLRMPPLGRADPAGLRVSPGILLCGFLLVAASASVVAILFLHPQEAGPVYRKPELHALPPGPPPKRSMAPARVSAPPRPAKQAPAAPTPEPEIPAAVFPVRAEEPPDISPSESPSAPVTPRAIPAPEPVASTRDPLIGTWLYARQKAASPDVRNMLYVPEYIEMVIQPQDSGRIVGRYKGRFPVPDLPISSEIAFRFEGASGREKMTFHWESTDGARGEIRMKMLSGGFLEVSWYTTRFGSEQKLASGTSILVRN